MQDDILTASEAAAILGVCPSRITALCHRKNKPLQYRLIGGKMYPYRQSVEQYKNDPARLRYACKSGPKVPTYLRKSRENEHVTS